MANGILEQLTGRPQPIMPTVDPMAVQPVQPQQPPQSMAARQQGLAEMPMRAPGIPQAAETGFGGPGGMQRLNELYGIMAAGAADPTQLGQDYVRAMQQQQQLDRANQPINKYLQIYGKVNPHDWSPESMQRFHNHYVQTGELRHELLEERKRLSSETEKQIYAAFDKADTAGNMAMSANQLAGRFEDAAVRGDTTIGIGAWVDQWLTENITGQYADINDMRKQFKALRLENVLKSLPPGVASDRDVRIAFEAFPSGNEDPAYVAAYLRGIQKLQIYDYAKNQHKAEYLSLEKGPAFAAKDWKENGYKYVEDAMDAMGVQLYNDDYFGQNPISGREAAQYLARTRGYGQSFGGGTTLRGGAPIPGGQAAPAPAAPAAGMRVRAQPAEQMTKAQRRAMLREAAVQGGY